MKLDSGQVALSIGSLCVGLQCAAADLSGEALALCRGGKSSYVVAIPADTNRLEAVVLHRKSCVPYRRGRRPPSVCRIKRQVLKAELQTCVASTDDGVAMTLGVYDDAQRRSVVSRRITVGDILGSDYTMVDLGVLTLGEDMYAWAAPVVRPKEEAEAVYLDRVVLVREHAE